MSFTSSITKPSDLFLSACNSRCGAHLRIPQLNLVSGTITTCRPRVLVLAAIGTIDLEHNLTPRLNPRKQSRLTSKPSHDTDIIGRELVRRLDIGISVSQPRRRRRTSMSRLKRCIRRRGRRLKRRLELTGGNIGRDNSLSPSASTGILSNFLSDTSF